MAMKWIVLASVLCLALGEDSKDKEVQAALAAMCCVAEKVFPPIYDNDDQPKKCLKLDDENTKVNLHMTEAEQCSMIECILREKKLLNEDKTVKVEELKKVMQEQAHADAKSVVKAAIDKCFKEFAENPDKKNCSSGVVKLYRCVTRHVLENCPKTLWRKDVQKCQ